jgi:hypothetical protein
MELPVDDEFKAEKAARSLLPWTSAAIKYCSTRKAKISDRVLNNYRKVRIPLGSVANSVAQTQVLLPFLA